MTAPTITKIILLEFALSYSRIFVGCSCNLNPYNWHFKTTLRCFASVIVHGVCSCFRCLIFKVHRLCSLYKISVVSSVALNRSDLYILARRVPNVKNFFRFLKNFFHFRGFFSPFRSGPVYNSTQCAICQYFFWIFSNIFSFPFYPN